MRQTVIGSERNLTESYLNPILEFYQQFFTQILDQFITRKAETKATFIEHQVILYLGLFSSF